MGWRDGSAYGVHLDILGKKDETVGRVVFWIPHWSVHLFVKREYWVFGTDSDNHHDWAHFGCKAWGLGPLALFCYTMW